MPPSDLLAGLPTRSGPALKILFCGDLKPGGTSRHRREAMERLGHTIVEFDPFDRLLGASRWRARLMLRVLAGPSLSGLQRALLDLADHQTVDIAWIDKGIFIRRETVAALSRRGVMTVHYSSDLPFGTRAGDVGQRLLNAAIPAYDVCVVPSPEHEPVYHANGARSVARMRFGFDPLTHYPRAAGSFLPEPPVDIRFIGTPYGDRARVLLSLLRDHDLRVEVNGGRWDRVLDHRDWEALRPGSELVGADYREAIWSSAICLGFVTHEMRHDEARRWVEIAACGGFLLAERPAIPGPFFRPGSDLVHYQDVADLAKTAKRFLNHPDARAQVASSALDRVWPVRSNDALLDILLTRLAGRELSDGELSDGELSGGGGADGGLTPTDGARWHARRQGEST